MDKGQIEKKKRVERCVRLEEGLVWREIDKIDNSYKLKLWWKNVEVSLLIYKKAIRFGKMGVRNSIFRHFDIMLMRSFGRVFLRWQWPFPPFLRTLRVHRWRWWVRVTWTFGWGVRARWVRWRWRTTLIYNLLPPFFTLVVPASASRSFPAFFLARRLNDKAVTTINFLIMHFFDCILGVVVVFEFLI